MPIYEYDCPRCGTFEVSQKMSDPTLATHDACGAPVSRRISLTSFSLKGGGWSSDGYGAKQAGAPDRPPCQGGTGAGCGSGACAAKAEA